jgi:uncharacterized protein YjiK
MFNGYYIPGKILRTLRLTGDGKTEAINYVANNFFPTRLTRTHLVILPYVITPTLLIFPSQRLKMRELFQQRTTQKPKRPQLK